MDVFTALDSNDADLNSSKEIEEPSSSVNTSMETPRTEGEALRCSDSPSTKRTNADIRESMNAAITESRTAERNSEFRKWLYDISVSANEAIDTDRKGYEHSAKKQYESVVAELEAFTKSMEARGHEEDIPVLRSVKNYISLYKLRISDLTPEVGQSYLDHSEDASYGFQEPVFQVNFHENPLCLLEKSSIPNPPQSPRKRPFWLLKRITKTMVEGGHITANIYIPKEVWHQRKVKIFGLNAKTTFCKNLTEKIKALREFDYKEKNVSMDKIVTALQYFQSQCDHLQNQLAKTISVPTVAESGNEESKGSEPIMRVSTNLRERFWKFKNTITKKAQKMGFTGSRSRGGSGSSAGDHTIDPTTGLSAPTDPTTTTPTSLSLPHHHHGDMYIPYLINLFSTSTLLDDWIDFFEAKPYAEVHSVLAVLGKIAAFYHSVVCAFVLKDLAQMLERYLKKSRESFSRLWDK